jgi:quinol monooxygenase YgiN
VLLVTARITTAPGAAAELLPAARRMVEATRQEDGCLSYELLQSVESEDSYVMLESWRDRAALDAHMTAPAMVEFGAAAGALLTGVDITVHDVTSSGPL